MKPPRELLADPFAFGQVGATLADQHARTPAGQAAMLQHMVFAQVRARMRQRGTTAAHLARQSRFSDRHLRRLMVGEQWARLTDLTALADALEMDLLLLAGPMGEDGRRSVVRPHELA